MREVHGETRLRVQPLFARCVTRLAGFRAFILAGVRSDSNRLQEVWGRLCFLDRLDGTLCGRPPAATLTPFGRGVEVVGGVPSASFVMYDRGVGVDVRANAVKRFQTSCERDQQIIAAFLGGSLATGMGDDVSDVDIYAVTREPEYSEFFARREAFMQSWARPVFLADTLNFEGLGFDMVHFVLADGVNGELALGHTGNFHRLHGGPHKVLVDKIGLLEGVTFPLYVPSESERRHQADHALTWFWLDFIQLGKHAQRNNQVAAALQLARLRAHCTVLIQIARSLGLVTDVNVFSNRLASTMAARDLQDVWMAACAIAKVHHDVGMLVGERLRLDYPVELADVAREKLHRAARTDANQRVT
ncbi:MAG: hypothetical protein M3069_01600 [Chloroflexota bacterium]|nr:hypothetical protein [Chloroflexota bacterium]